MPVQSTPNANELDPGGIGLSPEKDSYTDVYKRVVRDVLSRIDQRLADIAAQAGAPRSTEPAGGKGVPPTRLRRSLHRRALRGAIGVLMVASLSTAALAWYYADPMTTVMARWMPSFLKTAATNDADVSTSDLTSSSARPPAPPVQPTDLGSAPPQNGSFASGVQGPAEHGDITTASIDRDLMPLIQKLARDISELQVGIEQLKAGQEQVVRDQARAAEQLQAGQDQLMRQMARISAVQPPKPIAPSPRVDALRPPSAALPPPRPRTANTAQTLFPR
ncbi:MULTISPECIES: hypothetical protein [unclassified Bradyrhizobium]|uniref:hypothetical protein n=1 Tax=unclassified Bradyrhizobium TaxID=2631580 RepID=UPI0028EE29A1|nr:MULTISPECIES: hypothetical protein [unclassified Bradyrhizobium]